MEFDSEIWLETLMETLTPGRGMQQYMLSVFNHSY